jgi:hypothetical protein
MLSHLIAIYNNDLLFKFSDDDLNEATLRSRSESENSSTCKF